MCAQLVFIDMAELSNALIYATLREEPKTSEVFYLAIECELRPRRKADRDCGLLYSCKADGRRLGKTARNEFLPNPCGAGREVLETVIAHTVDSIIAIGVRARNIPLSPMRSTRDPPNSSEDQLRHRTLQAHFRRFEPSAVRSRPHSATGLLWQVTDSRPDEAGTQQALVEPDDTRSALRRCRTASRLRRDR